MQPKHYLVVGAGLYGSVFARMAAESGHKVTVVEKRTHIAGNCYTEKVDGIVVHKYGPHAFHTNCPEIWDFVNRFAKFNDFKLQVKVNFKNKMYSFPINLFTLNQLYGVTYRDEALRLLDQKRLTTAEDNFESYILGNLGEEIYKTFFEGYTRKQWGIEPATLSASVAKRIPIRYDFNDFYFADTYQGIPMGGYTGMVANMLDHENIKVQLGVDFFENRADFERGFSRIVYSGKVDELFDYKYGLLEYRSLKFWERRYDDTYQGNSIINYTDANIPYTRVVEHKYFETTDVPHSIVTFEYSQAYDETKIPFYPMPTQNNAAVYAKYKEDADNAHQYIIGGRLGRYVYLNMDQVIGMALKDARQELNINS